jgi:hypothetical protein
MVYTVLYAVAAELPAICAEQSPLITFHQEPGSLKRKQLKLETLTEQVSTRRPLNDAQSVTQHGSDVTQRDSDTIVLS